MVLTTAFVVVRSSQNCITLQGSHYYQATVGLNVAVNITQGVRDDGLSRIPTSADSIIGTNAAPHKGIFGAIPAGTGLRPCAAPWTATEAAPVSLLASREEALSADDAGRVKSKGSPSETPKGCESRPIRR